MKNLLIVSSVAFVVIVLLMGSCGPAITIPITPISFPVDFNPAHQGVRGSGQLMGLEQLQVDIPAMPELRGFNIQELLPEFRATLEEFINAFDFEVFFSRDGYSTGQDSLFAQGAVQGGTNEYSVDRNVPGANNLLGILNQQDQQETLFVSVRHSYQGDYSARGNMEVGGRARVGLDLFQ